MNFISRTLCTLVASAEIALDGCAILGIKPDFPEPKQCAHYMELSRGPHTPVSKTKTYHFCGDRELVYVKIENDFNNPHIRCRAVARYYQDGHASPSICAEYNDLNWEGAAGTFHTICIGGMNSGNSSPGLFNYDIYYCEQPVREDHW